MSALNNQPEDELQLNTANVSGIPHRLEISAADVLATAARS